MFWHRICKVYYDSWSGILSDGILSDMSSNTLSGILAVYVAVLTLWHSLPDPESPRGMDPLWLQCFDRGARNQWPMAFKLVSNAMVQPESERKNVRLLHGGVPLSPGTVRVGEKSATVSIIPSGSICGYLYVYMYMFFLTLHLIFFPAYTLTFYLASFPAFYLASILTYFLAYILTFFLAFYLASILTFCLDLSSIYSGILFGIFSSIHSGILFGIYSEFYLDFWLSIWHVFKHSCWHSIGSSLWHSGSAHWDRAEVGPALIKSTLTWRGTKTWSVLPENVQPSRKPPFHDRDWNFFYSPMGHLSMSDKLFC